MMKLKYILGLSLLVSCGLIEFSNDTLSLEIVNKTKDQKEVMVWATGGIKDDVGKFSIGPEETELVDFKPKKLVEGEFTYKVDTIVRSGGYIDGGHLRGQEKYIRLIIYKDSIKLSYRK